MGKTRRGQKGMWRQGLGPGSRVCWKQGHQLIRKLCLIPRNKKMDFIPRNKKMDCSNLRSPLPWIVTVFITAGLPGEFQQLCTSDHHHRSTLCQSSPSGEHKINYFINNPQEIIIIIIRTSSLPPSRPLITPLPVSTHWRAGSEGS